MIYVYSHPLVCTIFHILTYVSRSQIQLWLRRFILGFVLDPVYNLPVFYFSHKLYSAFNSVFYSIFYPTFYFIFHVYIFLCLLKYIVLCFILYSVVYSVRWCVYLIPHFSPYFTVTDTAMTTVTKMTAVNWFCNWLTLKLKRFLFLVYSSWFILIHF